MKSALGDLRVFSEVSHDISEPMTGPSVDQRLRIMSVGAQGRFTQRPFAANPSEWRSSKVTSLKNQKETFALY